MMQFYHEFQIKNQNITLLRNSMEKSNLTEILVNQSFD